MKHQSSARIFADPGGRRRHVVITFGVLAAGALVAWLVAVVVGLAGAVSGPAGI
ncbi:hypothetical protein [Catelliglobosispora koreensis]|uniref:hypothetical protein n=1 Tax=Catelliglobosispora koreensis TaxID=129052 RepID=UPI0003A4C16E|nr:hypothetical protein [Catelliglobosispora koreensis]